jgi:hypothetical protein
MVFAQLFGNVVIAEFVLDKDSKNTILPINKLVYMVEKTRFFVLTLFLILKFVCGILSAGI